MRLRRWEEAGYAALAAALGTLAGFLVLRPWRGSLRVPYSYIGDANYYHSVLKGVLEHGWFWHNPSLGAPGQQQLFDFPNVSGDLLDVFVWKFLGLFTSDSAVVLNLFFLLTFPAAALTAYLVLRRLDLAGGVDRVLRPLHGAAVPLHARGVPLAPAAYYAVPLGAYLVLAVLGQRPLFGSRRMVFGTLAMCAVIAFASGGYYYSAFTILLVAGGAVVRAVGVRSWRPLLDGGAVAGTILVLSLVTLAPSFVYWARRSERRRCEPGRVRVGALRAQVRAARAADRGAPDRCAGEAAAEVRRQASVDRGRAEHGARDRRGARVPVAAARLFCADGDAGAAVRGGSRGAGGCCGSAGVAVRVVRGVVGVRGRGRAADPGLEPVVDLHRVLRADRGGARVRSGARVDAREWRSGAVVGLGGLGLVVVLGLLDQTSRTYEPDYSGIAASYRSDGDFVRGIEAQVPAGSMIFQMPYRPFPEAPALGAIADYDLFRGYLHSDTCAGATGS